MLEFGTLFVLLLANGLGIYAIAPARKEDALARQSSDRRWCRR